MEARVARVWGCVRLGVHGGRRLFPATVSCFVAGLAWGLAGLVEDALVGLARLLVGRSVDLGRAGGLVGLVYALRCRLERVISRLAVSVLRDVITVRGEGRVRVEGRSSSCRARRGEALFHVGVFQDELLSSLEAWCRRLLWGFQCNRLFVEVSVMGSSITIAWRPIEEFVGGLDTGFAAVLLEYLPYALELAVPGRDETGSSLL